MVFVESLMNSKAHFLLRHMKKDYWNVDDAQVIEKTGRPIAEWTALLDNFNAATKKSNDVVAHLQNEYKVPRYWARTLTTHYLKENGHERA